MTLVPHTTSVRGSGYEVAGAARFLRPGAFDAQNLITISLVKLLRKLGDLPPGELARIENAARAWLGL